MATVPKTVTYEEWLRMPVVEDAVEEVVNGEIRIMPPNKLPHAAVVQRLISALVKQLDEEKIAIYGSVFGLVIRREPLSCRVPDVALFVRDELVEQDGYIHSAPELVIEVLSPGNTRGEREEKLRDYASLGVPEVWVVSPEGRTVEVLELEQGRLETKAIVNQGQLRPRRFPEAPIDVPALWPQ